MDIIKEKTVCFTGHRPEKLPGYNDGDSSVLAAIKSSLYYQIYRAAEEGFRFFISGLAKGVDMWAAKYVLDIRKKFPDIVLICVKPFEQHGKGFKGADLYEYSNILSGADEVICLSGSYNADCYKKRNYFMVDHSSMVIAVIGNYHSGTGQTVNYARKKGLEIRVIRVSDYLSASAGQTSE